MQRRGRPIRCQIAVRRIHPERRNAVIALAARRRASVTRAGVAPGDVEALARRRHRRFLHVRRQRHRAAAGERRLLEVDLVRREFGADRRIEECPGRRGREERCDWTTNRRCSGGHRECAAARRQMDIAPAPFRTVAAILPEFRGSLLP